MDTLMVPVNAANDHIQGNMHAPVTLVEYGGYEHARCGKAHASIKQIQADMGDELQFVYRHFPLPQLYPNDLHAAFAAEAAGMQGKFWTMHDLLHEHADILEDQELIGYAADIGLELEQFISDMASIDVRLKVRRDVESGVRSGVSDTPTFYINGRLQLHGPACDYPVLRAAVEDAIAVDQREAVLVPG